MALNEKLRDRIRAFSAELRREVYGPQGYPAWGTKFIDIENQTGEVGDAIACEMLSQGLREQAKAAGHRDGKCHCGEPIPLEEIAGRLLQAKRGEAQWQETFGQCKRCRKAFFPSVASVGHRAG
ncbi:MAG: hypothetical protein NTY65_00805 [Planctomycetota bacterium]|nr:hypothetical protein [Planctomycetota bacterium]